MTSPTLAPRRRLRLTRVERWTVVGVAIFLLVVMQLGLMFDLTIFKLLGVSIGLSVFYIAYKHPMGNARFLLIWLPLSPVILAAIYSFLRVPAALVQNGTYLRFLMVLALLLAGAKKRKANEREFDIIDRLAIGYFAIVVAYVLITPYLTAMNLTVSVRAQGLQALTLFVAAFVGIRWLEPSPEDRRALRRWAYALIMIVGLLGIYQRLDPVGFRRLMFQHLEIDVYFRDVAKLSGPGLSDQITWYWLEPPRVSSIALAPFEFADLMLVGAALAVEELTRRFHPKDLILLGVSGVGIWLSGTRINLIAIGAMMLVAGSLRAPSERARVRFMALLVVFGIAMAPLVLGSRLVKGDATSNEGHTNELTTAFDTVLHNPLGGGVGTDGAINRRFSSGRTLVSGNTVLGIGIQVGVLGMGVFIALLVAMLSRNRVGRALSPPQDIALGRLLIISGIVSGLTHNAWTSYGPGSFAWLLIGLGVGAAVEKEKRPERLPFRPVGGHMVREQPTLTRPLSMPPH